MKLCFNHTHTNFNFSCYAVFSAVVVSVDIREIKEVRETLDSYDNKRSPDDYKMMEPNCGFIILYGSEFRLKSLSVGGMRVSASNCVTYLWLITVFLISDAS